jgi:hypothetical protein
MDSSKLTPATSGFVLAAAITALVNRALASAKEAYAPLRAIMKSVAGHDWTAQGLFDLALFAGLGFIFMNTRTAEKMDPSRLIAILAAAVVFGGLGLALWFAFV